MGGRPDQAAKDPPLSSNRAACPTRVARHADCAHYGVTTGFSCVTMCWALMVAAVAFSHSLMVMTVLFGVQMSGRYKQRPSQVLAALAVLGVCLLSFAA